MNNAYSKSADNSYSAKKMTKPIHFFCDFPQAVSVCLIGDFNDWNPTAHPMQHQPDGSWFLEVPLPHGHHAYLFLVDGKSRPDARAMGAIRNDRYGLISLIAVS